MSELNSEITAAISAIAGGGMVLALVKWLLGREIHRNDTRHIEHSTRLDDLEEKCVGEHTIQSLRAEVQAGFRGVHHSVDRKFTALSTRIDDILRNR